MQQFGEVALLIPLAAGTASCLSFWRQATYPADPRRWIAHVFLLIAVVFGVAFLFVLARVLGIGLPTLGLPFWGLLIAAFVCAAGLAWFGSSQGWLRVPLSGYTYGTTEHAAESFLRLLYQSRWAKSRAKQWRELPALAYETDKPEVDVIEGRLRAALDRELHNALRKGMIEALGTGGATNTERPIVKEEWDNIRLDFSERKLTGKAVDGGPPAVSAWKATKDLREGGRLVYTQVKFVRRTVNKQFPLALFSRKRPPSNSGAARIRSLQRTDHEQH